MFAQPDGGVAQRRQAQVEENRAMLGPDYQPPHLVGSGKMHENGFADMPRDMQSACRSQGNKASNG